jgi:hypothetical protein
MQRELNILRVYHQAGSGEIDAGLRWYLIAHDEAVRLANAGGLTIEATSGIIAAVSPGLRWESNIAAAERIIHGEGLEGIGVRWYRNVIKAKRILHGENPADVLKGNKVRAFWNNILEPLVSESVCIDGHAYAIWAGKRIMLDKVPSISDNLYAQIQGDYRSAAKLAGIRPLQLQAISWCVWRRIHQVNSAHYLPLFEE